VHVDIGHLKGGGVAAARNKDGRRPDLGAAHKAVKSLVFRLRLELIGASDIREPIRACPFNR
jgi:hypothetical protein